MWCNFACHMQWLSTAGWPLGVFLRWSWEQRWRQYSALDVLVCISHCYSLCYPFWTTVWKPNWLSWTLKTYFFLIHNMILFQLFRVCDMLSSIIIYCIFWAKFQVNSMNTFKKDIKVSYRLTVCGQQHHYRLVRDTYIRELTIMQLSSTFNKHTHEY